MFGMHNNEDSVDSYDELDQQIQELDKAFRELLLYTEKLELKFQRIRSGMPAWVMNPEDEYNSINQKKDSDKKEEKPNN